MGRAKDSKRALMQSDKMLPIAQQSFISNNHPQSDRKFWSTGFLSEDSNFSPKLRKPPAYFNKQMKGWKWKRGKKREGLFFFFCLCVCEAIVHPDHWEAEDGGKIESRNWREELVILNTARHHTHTHTGLCDQSDLYFVIFKTWIKQMCRCTCSVWFSLLCASTAERSFHVYCVFRGHVQGRCVCLSVFMPFFSFSFS